MATQPLATPTPAPVPQRALRRWDWILGAFFLAIYWALALGVGVRGIAAVTGIAVMAIAFFFPKPGIYALAWILLAEVTFLIISSVAKVAANRGDPNTELGWQIIWDTFAALAALGVMGALWLAVAFRARLTGFRWRLTPFEESLAWLGILTILWIPVGLGNDVDIFYMAFDVQLMFYYPTAILISRAFAPKDWPPFFVWVVAGVFVHWLVMLADLAFGGVFVNPQFITDVVRHTIGGSPDLSAPFVPPLLALAAIAPPARKHHRFWLWVLVLVFTFHVFASLFRSAIAQYVLSMVVLAAMLAPAERRRMGQLLLATFVGLGLMVGAVAVAQPAVFKLGRAAVLGRITETVGPQATSNPGQDLTDPLGQGQGESLSNRHRKLEGQRAIEDLRDDWITGRGPGAHIYKRFWAHESARKEAYLHNGYLWFILKFGVLGVLVIGWVYARFFGVAAKLRLGRDLEPWQRAVTVGYVAVVIPMLIFAWTNNIIAQPGGLYFLLPGLAWFAYLERTALPRSPAPAPADPA